MNVSACLRCGAVLGTGGCPECTRTTDNTAPLKRMRIIKFTECLNCPYIEAFKHKGTRAWCAKYNQSIYELYSIPNFCELEEFPYEI